MNFNQFVIRNTIRNKRLYIAYFFSTLFSVMTFFTFATLAYHPDLVTKIKGSGGTKANAVNQGMMGAAVIIFIFSFIFVLYSMDVFLQSRKKEFGSLIMQGMSPRQLKQMIFIENLVIGISSTFLGILSGLLFSQLIQLFARFFMHFTLHPYFPVKAIVLTLLSFLVLFLVISILVQFMLPKANLKELLKADESGKGELKVSKLKAFLGFFLLFIGYAVALYVKGAQVLAVMLPVIVIVILGTYFFFNQFTVLAVQGLKKNEHLFWKKTNLVVFSDLSFRMKDNARSFFFVSIVSTVAFAAIGTLYGFKAMTTQVFDLDPYEYTLSENMKDVSSAQKEIEHLFTKEKIDYDVLHLKTYRKDDQSKTLIPVSAYNRLAKLNHKPVLSLKENEGIEVSPDLKGRHNEKLETKELVLPSGTIHIDKTAYANVLPMTTYGYVVSDKLLYGLPEENFVLYYTKDANLQSLYKVGQVIGEKYQIFGEGFMKETSIRGNNALFFVGTFIGLVFFVSAASFLYFRLYSDMREDVKKFKMIYKLGLSPKEMKKMIYQQVGILFFTPIVISLLHGSIALTAMYHAAGGPLEKEAYYVLIAFLGIQLLYYFIARTFYYRNVERQVIEK